MKTLEKAGKMCGTFFIIISLAAMIVFACFGCGSKNAEENKPIDLTGTWKVVAYDKNGSASIIDNEYMVFTAESAVDYRDGAEYVTSTYTIDGSGNLRLKDISREYVVSKLTENYICLYENKTDSIRLIRYAKADMSPLDIHTERITGKWDIVYRNTDKAYQGDYLQFDNGTISQFVASQNKIAASASYIWEGSHLVVADWNKDMVMYPVSDKVIILVEIASDTGFVWELHLNQ